MTIILSILHNKLNKILKKSMNATYIIIKKVERISMCKINTDN